MCVRSSNFKSFNQSCSFDSQEIDAYKSTTKEELSQWLNLLRQSGNSSDWIIILVRH